MFIQEQKTRTDLSRILNNMDRIISVPQKYGIDNNYRYFLVDLFIVTGCTIASQFWHGVSMDKNHGVKFLSCFGLLCLTDKSCLIGQSDTAIMCTALESLCIDIDHAECSGGSWQRYYRDWYAELMGIGVRSVECGQCLKTACW